MGFLHPRVHNKGSVRTGQNRRRFLQSSLAAGATFAISGTKSSGNILGANDRLRVAVAGLHGRGRSPYGACARMKDVQVASVVDLSFLARLQKRGDFTQQDVRQIKKQILSAES